MGLGLSKTPILVKREIEARIAGPLISAFMEEFGKERTLKVVQRVIDALAKELGKQLARDFGGNSLHDWVAKGMAIYERDGTCQSVILEHSENRLSFNVVRCRIADMVKELGMPELGVALFCNRDMAMYTGFNPKIKFSRSKTIMGGADYCDFRCVCEE